MNNYDQAFSGISDTSCSPMPDLSGFAKVVLIDCGRGYYDLDTLRHIIDTMSECHYDYLMLGFGNDGLRFLLKDMSVKVGDTVFSDRMVREGIEMGNDQLGASNGCVGQWSEEDMEGIISYASSRGIGIVPLLNGPGHAWSICRAMVNCGIEDCFCESGGTDLHNLSVNLRNPMAVHFLEALVRKYIQYFADKGCSFFNLGCDEIGGNCQGQGENVRNLAVAYVTRICSSMPESMVPMAFGDVLRNCSGYPARLVGIDWDGHFLEGHENFNANSQWYYVLGNSETEDGWSSYHRAIRQTRLTAVTDAPGGEQVIGSILAVWNDHFVVPSGYLGNIQSLIREQALGNSIFFH